MQITSKATEDYLRKATVAKNDRLFISLTKDKKQFLAHFYSVHEGQKRYPTYYGQAFTNRFYQKHQVNVKGNMGLNLELPITDYTCELIFNAWPKEQVMYSKEALKHMQLCILRGMRLDMNAKRVAEYKKNGKVPKHDLELHPEHPLSPYQQIALINSMDSAGYDLFMEQGTGKTAVVVARVCNEAKRKKGDQPYRVLILCPKNVRANWVAEFKKFGTQPGKCKVLRGDSIQRMKCLVEGTTIDNGEKYHVIIASYGSACSKETWEYGISKVDWDLVVWDECHYVKSNRTVRYKTSQKIRDVARARMGLTGTPITNHAFDLYTQFEILGENYSGFSTYEAFRQFFGNWESGQYGIQKLLNYENLPLLQERMARMAFLITKEEALPTLPEKLYDIYEVTMEAKQRQAYQDVRDMLMAEVQNELSGEVNALTINGILSKMLRLAQVTSGFLPVDTEFDSEGNVISREIHRFDPNPKIEAVCDILKDKGPNDKTLIWCCWKPDIKTLSARMRYENIDAVTFYGGTSDAKREEAEYRFNHDPACKVFIGNPAAGGTGLNLLGYPPGNGDSHSTNANHIIYFSQNWSSTARSQSEDRAHRRGTREHVRITDLVVTGTIDEEIRERVLFKRKAAKMISDLEEILSNILGGTLDNTKD